MAADDMIPVIRSGLARFLRASPRFDRTEQKMAVTAEGEAELCIFARFEARAGAEEDLVAAFHEMLPLVRAETGCLAIDIFRATRRPSLFYIHSRWRDEVAFDTHAEMPHTLRFVERAQKLITNELQVVRTRPLQ